MIEHDAFDHAVEIQEPFTLNVGLELDKRIAKRLGSSCWDAGSVIGSRANRGELSLICRTGNKTRFSCSRPFANVTGKRHSRVAGGRILPFGREADIIRCSLAAGDETVVYVGGGTVPVDIRIAVVQRNRPIIDRSPIRVLPLDPWPHETEIELSVGHPLDTAAK